MNPSRSSSSRSITRSRNGHIDIDCSSSPEPEPSCGPLGARTTLMPKMYRTTGIQRPRKSRRRRLAGLRAGDLQLGPSHERADHDGKHERRDRVVERVEGTHDVLALAVSEEVQERSRLVEVQVVFGVAVERVFGGWSRDTAGTWRSRARPCWGATGR